jgi:hypothetical protein
MGTQVSWRVLAVGAALAEGGDWMTATQIWKAVRPEISYSGVRNVLDKLAAQGLVERQYVNPHVPHRGYHWRVTPAGLRWGREVREHADREAIAAGKAAAEILSPR